MTGAFVRTRNKVILHISRLMKQFNLDFDIEIDKTISEENSIYSFFVSFLMSFEHFACIYHQLLLRQSHFQDNVTIAGPE